MSYWDDILADGYRLRVNVTEIGTNVVDNSSTVHRVVQLIKGTGSGKWADGPHTWNLYGGGNKSGSIGSYDFRKYSTLTLADDKITVRHGDDGTASLTGIRATFNDNNTWGEVGDGDTGSHALALTPLPRTPIMITQVVRLSDTQHRVSWARVSASTAIVVQRRTNDGAWVEVGRPGGNAASFTDTTTVANRKYEWRVAAILSGKQSGWSGVSAAVYTSPAAPSSVSAVRSGLDIRVSASGLPPYATGYDVDDSGTVIASGVSLPWTHAAPEPSAAHKYRLRGTRGTLAGPWSGWSNTVQLVSPPNPPAGLSPNGQSVASDASVRLSWTHNPVDASPQSAFEVQYRPTGGAWVTVSGGVSSFVDIPAGVGSFEWQVRTKGADPSFGGWSAAATFTVIDRPAVAINSPGTILDAPSVVVAWTYGQAQSRPQSEWEAELRDDESNVLESLSGSGADVTAEFTRRVSDGDQLEVRVRAAAGLVWSEWASQLFEVVFLPPAVPDISASWNDDLGGVAIEVAAREPLVNLFRGALSPVAYGTAIILSADDGSVSLFQPRSFGLVPASAGYALVESQPYAVTETLDPGFFALSDPTVLISDPAHPGFYTIGN